MRTDFRVVMEATNEATKEKLVYGRDPANNGVFLVMRYQS